MSTDNFTPLGDAPEDSITERDELFGSTERRLVETYRRLSRDLRRRGFDELTVHRMGRVEE